MKLKFSLKENNLRAALIIASAAVAFDFFIHYLLTEPMEIPVYFIAKYIWYFIFSIFFLSSFSQTNKNIIIGGIAVSLIWGAYYNFLPNILNYAPYGIALKGISFLGKTGVLSALLFGVTHFLGFIIGINLMRRV